MTKPKFFIAVPTYQGTLHFGTVHGLLRATRVPPQDYGINFTQSSFTTRVFNDQWCEAMNARKTHGITHFAMLHVDIAPEDFWLDKLYSLMQKHSADIIAASMPIKNREGITSNGWEEEPGRIRRWTLKEIHAMAEKTWTHESIVLNNGLMLCDITKPWAENVRFATESVVKRAADGTFLSVALPEDWYFSRQARLAGAKCYATGEVRAAHYGNAAYDNHFSWGTAAVDPGCDVPWAVPVG